CGTSVTNDSRIQQGHFVHRCPASIAWRMAWMERHLQGVDLHELFELQGGFDVGCRSQPLDMLQHMWNQWHRPKEEVIAERDARRSDYLLWQVAQRLRGMLSDKDFEEMTDLEKLMREDRYREI